MKVPVRSGPGRFLLLEPDEIFYVQAEGDDVLVRTARKSCYLGTRRLSAWEQRLGSVGFLRVHRSYLVNLKRVREVRLREDDPNDWELKLAPPVNIVLPIGRAYVASVRGVLGV
jgi:DNA-binding LytR/AlgR family response regulator